MKHPELCEFLELAVANSDISLRNGDRHVSQSDGQTAIQDLMEGAQAGSVPRIVLRCARRDNKVVAGTWFIAGRTYSALVGINSHGPRLMHTPLSRHNYYAEPGLSAEVRQAGQPIIRASFLDPMWAHPVVTTRQDGWSNERYWCGSGSKHLEINYVRGHDVRNILDFGEKYILAWWRDMAPPLPERSDETAEYYMLSPENEHLADIIFTAGGWANYLTQGLAVEHDF